MGEQAHRANRGLKAEVVEMGEDGSTLTPEKKHCGGARRNSPIRGLPPTEPGSGKAGHARDVREHYGRGPDNTYDRTAFFKKMPAGDPRTHRKVILSAAVPESVGSVVTRIIQTNIFPELQSVSDLLRWALSRGLEALLEIDSGVRGLSQGMVGIDQMLQEDKTYGEWIETQIQSLRELVQTHNAAGRAEFGMRAIYQFAQRVREMPVTGSGAVWTAGYLRKLEEQFGADIRKATEEAKKEAKGEKRRQRKRMQFRAAPGEDVDGGAPEDWGPQEFQVLDELAGWESWMPAGFAESNKGGK